MRLMVRISCQSPDHEAITALEDSGSIGLWDGLIAVRLNLNLSRFVTSARRSGMFRD